MLSRAVLPLPDTSRARAADLKSLFSRKRSEPCAIACVTAHPGDEIIAAGGSIHEWTDACFIHITEGSPRDLDRAFQAGYECRDEYVRARQHEVGAALHCVGLSENQSRNLGYEDGEIANHLASVAMTLAAAFHESAAQIVITHPYEGVHPDYDSTAFAAQAACRLLERDGIAAPVRIEVAGIHRDGDEVIIGEFLSPAATESVTVRLDTTHQQLKRAALDCLSSQSALWENVALHSESFRIAPSYDFTNPPHPGILEYERSGLGMTGRRWRRLAAEALRILGLSDLS
jgi:LmbE family N-acetylglucosaminyl deacetylase